MYTTLITSRQLFNLTNIKPSTTMCWVKIKDVANDTEYTEYKIVDLAKDQLDYLECEYICPAYTLGFLVREIQEVLIGEEYCSVQLNYSSNKLVWYAKLKGYSALIYNETPEDAVARLIMYLYRNDVL